MKSPDEIKKGLECAVPFNCNGNKCSTCPNATYSLRELMAGDLIKDALAYIDQLESTYGQVSKALCGKKNATLNEVLTAVDQLKDRLAQAERERDAAVLSLHGNCEDCRFEDTPKCNGCIRSDDAWGVYDELWEWRGVCEENSK